MPIESFEDITYRSLRGDELTKLLPALQKLDWFIPYPATACALVAEVKGEIVGFSIMQLIPHNEPLWVSKEWRGSGLAFELVHRTVQEMGEMGAAGFVAVAQNSFSERLCECIGMKRVDGVLYVKKAA